MKTIFTTEDVKSGDRFGFWHEIACAHIVDHLSLPQCKENFEARIQAASIADIELILLENAPTSYSRTQNQASIEESGKLILCQQLQGRTMMEQDGRTAILYPGQIALFDPQLPYLGRSMDSSRLLITKVPRRGLEARLGSLRMASATIVNADAPPDDFLSAFVAMLPRYAGALEPGLQDLVQEQLVGLLAAALAKILDRPGLTGSDTLALTRLRVQAAIDAMLPDPELTVRDVAARAGVSVRYANEALAGEQTSIMRRVLARRLARCRQALEDALQDRRSISAIAYGWGFSDMTHFARRFSQAYGMLPRDYRRMARSGRHDSAVSRLGAMAGTEFKQ